MELEPNKSRNIIQVIPTIRTECGGPTRAALGLNAALNEFQSCILVHTDADKGDLRKTRNQILSFRGNKTLRILRLLKFVSTSSADFAIVHGLHRPESWLSGAVFKFKKIPYFVQLHGTLEPITHSKNPYKKHLFYSFIGKYYLRCAKSVIVASSQEQRNALSIDHKIKTLVNHLAVNLWADHAENPKIQLSDNFWNTKKSKRVLFMSRLARGKHPEIAVKLVNLNSDLHFVIAGPEDDWTNSQLLKLIEPSNRVRVDFTGELDDPTKWWMLRNTEVFIFPTEHENFGIVAIEAMVAGNQLVISKATPTSEFIGRYGTGKVVETLDLADWDHALKEVISEQFTSDDKIRRQEMAVNYFSWRRFVQRFEEHMESTP
jgi:glycosyltransferase involved in cell wall biosynthesis